MSSESEDDDFLSADEGDNEEEISEKQIDCSNIEVKGDNEKSHETDKEDRNPTEKLKEMSKDIKDIIQTEECYEIIERGVPEIESNKDDYEKQEFNDEPAQIYDTKVEVTDKSILSNWEAIQQVTKEEYDGGEKLKIDKSCTSDLNLKEVNVSECKTETLQPKDISKSENDDFCSEEKNTEENTTHHIQTEKASVFSDKSKSNLKKGPLKESKIGLKKPREKLGERLGAKKLGSRITKPLVGISSDSLNSTESTLSSCNESSYNLNKNESELKKMESKENEKNFKEDEEGSLWGSWGDWSSSLATAASTLSKEVTRGVGTVLETVESGLGAPDPSDLAKELVEKEKLQEELKMEKKKEDNLKNEDNAIIEPIRESYAAPDEIQQQNYGFGFSTFGNIVSGVSGALETASSKVLLGGLDTLEKIGRKTMDIIQEGDPGLRRKRAFLTSNKPNLALVLLEARERAIEEETNRNNSSSSNEDRRNYVSMALVWDNTEGPVHLEALSLIAKQCQRKTNFILQELPPGCYEVLRSKISQIKSCSSIDEQEEVDKVHLNLADITRDVQLPLQFNKVLTGWPSLQEFLSKLSIEICGLGNSDFTSLQKDLYNEIAVYIACVVGIVHKAAELSLITPDLDTVKLAQQFKRFCGCISSGLEKSADDVCESISQALSASHPDFNDTITNIYVQIAEVNNYLETSLADLNTVLIQAEAKMAFREL